MDLVPLSEKEKLHERWALVEAEHGATQQLPYFPRICRNVNDQAKRRKVCTDDFRVGGHISLTHAAPTRIANAIFADQPQWLPSACQNTLHSDSAQAKSHGFEKPSLGPRQKRGGKRTISLDFRNTKLTMFAQEPHWSVTYGSPHCHS